MGTLSTLFYNTRIRLRELDVQFFTDLELISLSNDLFDSFYSELKSHDCKMIVGNQKISIVNGVNSYTIEGKQSLIPEMVFLESGESVPVYSLLRSDLFSFKESSTGITLYNYSDIDSIIVYYWKAFTELSSVADETPLEGLWDKALTESLTLRCKSIRGFEINSAAYYAQRSVNEALVTSINKYGTLTRKLQGALNV